MHTITRFAPSPTGFLHRGHLFSALFARRAAGEHGQFLLRIEDIDQTRCRPEYKKAIFEDLSWLGFTWAEPALTQSAHMPLYQSALRALRLENLLYPCFCTRADIAQQIRNAAGAPNEGDGSILYPGSCRHLSMMERRSRIRSGVAFAWRLHMERALERVKDRPLLFRDLGLGEMAAAPEKFGDVVLARKDCSASYHLCVVVDDARQHITLVTRGMDLLPATDVHVLLQRLLHLPTPQYHHHPLLRDAGGRRLAKRDGDESLRQLRENGASPQEILREMEENLALTAFLPPD